MLIRVLRTYLAPYKPFLACIVVLQFCSVAAMLYLPTLNAKIIDKGIVRGDQGYIVRIGGVMLVITLAQIVCQVSAGFFASRASMSFGRDLRRALFHKVGSLSSS